MLPLVVVIVSHFYCGGIWWKIVVVLLIVMLFAVCCCCCCCYLFCHVVFLSCWCFFRSLFAVFCAVVLYCCFWGFVTNFACLVCLVVKLLLSLVCWLFVTVVVIADALHCGYLNISLSPCLLLSLHPPLHPLWIQGMGVSRLCSNWYSWARDRFALMLSPDRVLLEDMPDAMDAHESVWVPHLRDKMQCGPNTIVVGHSSGAVAAMRLLEETSLLGVVLVAACHTDLGCEHEREAGYYDRPWQWDKIKVSV